MSWRAVLSALPPAGERVLACVYVHGPPGGDLWVAQTRVLLFTEAGDGLPWTDGDGRDSVDVHWYSSDDVTHWMPLPDLPGDEAPDYCHALSPRTRTGCTLLRGHTLLGTQHEAHAGSPDGPLIEAWPLGQSL